LPVRKFPCERSFARGISVGELFAAFSKIAEMQSTLS
jgi:hypothetical protein